MNKITILANDDETSIELNIEDSSYKISMPRMKADIFLVQHSSKDELLELFEVVSLDERLSYMCQKVIPCDVFVDGELYRSYDITDLTYNINLIRLRD